VHKSAIIFGGSGGIGRVVADFFVSAGYGVTIAARTLEPVDRTVQELRRVTPVSIEQIDNAAQELHRVIPTSIEQDVAGHASGGAALSNVRGQVADVMPPPTKYGPTQHR